MKRVVLGLCAIALAVSIFSCGEAKQEGIGETAFISDGVTASSSSETLNLKILINDIYCKQTACGCIHEVAAREYYDLLDKLKSEHNINLEFIYCPEVFYLEDSILTQKYDGAICKPWNAVRFNKLNNLNYKRIADVVDVFDNKWLTGNFLVPKESSMQTLEDINGKVLVIGMEDAIEKFDQAKQMLDMLAAKGIKPSRVYNKSSCLENMNELIDKNAEVAVVSDYVMIASCAVDVADPEDFRVIGETERTPLTSVILDMNKVSKEDALRLQNALLALSGANSPESMLSSGFVKPENWNPVPYTENTAK